MRFSTRATALTIRIVTPGPALAPEFGPADTKAEEEKRARDRARASEASGGEGESKPGSVSFDASAFAHKTSFASRPGLPRGHKS